MKNRLDWVDITKGLGMILVIVGHCVYFGKTMHNWIFSFHMPMFFILSGLFVKSRPIKHELKRKARSLLVPYFLFSMLGLGITLLIPVWRNKYGLKGLIYDIYMSSPDYINISSIWYLVCLFISMILLQYVIKLKERTQWIIIILMALIGFVFGSIHETIFFLPGKRLPFNLDVVPVSMLFLFLGYRYKDNIFAFVDVINKHMVKLLFFLSVTGIVSVILSVINGRVNLHGLTYNNVFVYFLAALFGSTFVVCVSSLVERLHSKNILKNGLIWCGRNSIKILGVQSIAIRLYILFVNEVFGTQYELYHLPIEHVYVSSFVVTFFSIIIVVLFDFVRKNIK